MDYTIAQDKRKTDSKVEEPKTSSKTEELHLSGDTLVVEDKGSAEKGGSTKSTDMQQSNVKPDESTVKPDESIVKPDESTVKQDEGVELKNVEDIERPRPTSTRSVLTLKPLPKIDPKAKGKGMIKEEDESDTELEDITKAEKKFKMLANNEEMARKVQEEWEAEKEKEKLAKEEATKAAFTNEYDFIQARLNADKILAEKLQEEEREKFTIEERAKLLHDTIAAQRRFLAQQRYEHVGGKKHYDLKTKFFEEIQVLYEKVKRSDENFITIGNVEDETLMKDAGIKKADSIKEESKEGEGTKKRKLGIRKKMKSRKRRFRKDTFEDDETYSEKENDELRLCLTIASDEEKEVDYEILDKKYPIIEWKSDNGQKRYFSTLMRVLSIFDKDDLNAVYQLVMDRYQDETPKCFDRVLWGDLMIMFNPSDEDEFWNSQHDWNVVLVIHMLVEKKVSFEKESIVANARIKVGI
ncbi:hypothetical protein Tco_1063394 [Tanacetum coccineum]